MEHFDEPDVMRNANFNARHRILSRRSGDSESVVAPRQTSYYDEGNDFGGFTHFYDLSPVMSLVENAPGADRVAFEMGRRMKELIDEGTERIRERLNEKPRGD